MKNSALHLACRVSILSFQMVACSQLAKEEKIPVKDSIPAVSKAGSLKKDSINSPGMEEANENDSIIRLQNGEAFSKGHISPKSSPKKYTLDVTAGETITASVKPLEKNGNVRINQLQLPDKSLDGPFGDSVTYIMKTKGSLTIIIGENMMAGDPWTGSFLLHVTSK